MLQRISFGLVIAIFLVLSATLFIPDLASAQGLAQLAECSGPDCGTCQVIKLANGIIVWLIGFVFLLFAVLLMRAGVLLVTSGGNPGALQSAKDNFINALIGLIIILAAWLIVDTLMKALVGKSGEEGSRGYLNVQGEKTGWLLWSQIECTAQVSPDLAVIDYITLERYDDGSQINESGITGGYPEAPPAVGNLVTYAGARFDASIVDRVRYIAETFNLRVSGGYRSPERNADVNGVPNSRHLTGRAADFVGTRANMEAGLNWARANGAVEGLIHNAGSGTHLHVAW